MRFPEYLNFRLPAGTVAALETRAKREGKSLADLVRGALAAPADRGDREAA